MLAQGAGAWLWWRVSPRGYPAPHPQGLANQVAPWAAVVLAGLALVWLLRGREARPRLVLALAGLVWAGVALGGLVVFPASGTRWVVAPTALALPLLALAAWRARARPRLSRAVPAALAALLAGGGLALTQRAGEPDTRPVGVEPRDGPHQARAPLARPWPVDLGTARVTLAANGVRLSLDPLLELSSVSPDRCWTLFAPRPAWPGLALEGWAERDDALVAWYRAPRVQRARVAVRRDGPGVRVEALTTLDAPVYSHLNAFTSLAAVTDPATPLLVAFSPCPDARVEARPADYPTGRPMRLAFLEADATFRVAEAASGEKGPFRELARGRLARGEPLTITVLAGARPAFDVTLEDWSAQAGTALSPTAGWGLPVNAIELRLDAPGRLGLWATLASTSVGRGYQSVGHAAGTYRNRVRITPR